MTVMLGYHKMGSENAHEYAQNAKNGFGVDFFRANSLSYGAARITAEIAMNFSVTT
jgi:hypothetical protein